MDVQVSVSTSRTRAVALHVHSAIGRPLYADVTVSSPEALDGAALVGTPARIEVTGREESVAIYHGIVASISAVATADPNAQRRYMLEIRSAIEWLRLRKNARVFRKKTAVAIVKEVLAGVGIEGDAFINEVGEEPPEREYVTQWNETDAVFLRRICEEEGLFFRFDPKDGFDAFVLCDRSSDAPVLADPLLFVDASALVQNQRAAYNPHHRRKRRPGKVAVRDYNPANPAVRLEAEVEAGLDMEKAVEVYEAPARFRSEREGQREARLRLEALRADADILEFETTALVLRPGVAFEADAHLAVGPVPEGKYFVLKTMLAWRAGEPEGGLAVKAIPLSVPYRLPRVSPRPRIPGILSATVTGASGEEIHTDAAGHVRVHFPWDREGPTDDKASLPVRVMQPNLPGSMLIPRVGWEVLVGFEDGDADRPYVLGRSFNGRQLPPFGLPANKTITALGSFSSPGGARPNMVHIDDAQGRQHMVWDAGYGKTTDVGAAMVNQTVGFETTRVTGNQTWEVGGDETISVEKGWEVEVGSQTAMVTGNQKLTLQAQGSKTVGSETVLVGGALIEKVGNPATGLAEFARAAVLAGVSQIPLVGPMLSQGYSWDKAIRDGYARGGLRGAGMAALQTAAGEIAGRFHADAIMAAADAAGVTPWSEKAQQRAAQQAQGGGEAGPDAGAAGAAQAAPGHRKLVVDGVVAEVIGGLHGIETPGSLKWTTLGASRFIVGGSHATSALRISRLTTRKSSDTAAATSIQARKAIGRNVRSAHTLKAGGSMDFDAGGEVGIKAEGALTIQVSGAASLEGGTVVFDVGDGASTVSVHGGSVTLKSAKITIDGKNKQSGKESTG